MECGGLIITGNQKYHEELPVFSIITVVYNGANTIEKTINSVLNQKYPNIEYIIVDGGSNDGTVEIIKKYENKISYWQSEPDKGIYDGMNKGIDLAHGMFINFLNSGDFFDVDAVETVYNSYKNSNNIDIFYGMMRVFDQQNKYLWVYGRTVNFLKSAMIAHPTCFVRKNVYKENKFDITLRSAADYDLFIRLYQKGYNFSFIEKIYVNFILGGTSDSYLGMLEGLYVMRKYGYLSKFSYFRKSLPCRIKKFLHK